MHDFCTGYAFNVIERNELWKEYMQVEEEEGEWENIDRSRLRRQQQESGDRRGEQ
jgi:hypothetical protein